MDPEQLRTGAEVAGTGAAIYRVLAERAAAQRAGTEAAVEHRIAVEAELRSVLGSAQFDPHRELIVVDAARAVRYPDPDEKFRLLSVSPWFKSEGPSFLRRRPGGRAA